ncbi:MAG: nucleotidyl transferase AbiEii/AbiGii toxin family protein [Armatimonadota bacterium]
MLHLSRKTGTDFGVTLTNYAFERLLYRLSCSPHRERFVLKGAMLFRIWSGDPHRATRDMDLMAFGNPAADDIAGLFREMCTLDLEDDGVIFQEGRIRTEEIRETQEYDGVRVKLIAQIAGARIPLQIDVGFGDAVVPPAEEMLYPTLLGFPAPQIKTYTRETVIAEKFQSMVSLGIANSRLKDFYDIYWLASSYGFSGQSVGSAIRATFERRSTSIPSVPPIALTEEFSGDPAKVNQWRAFITGRGVKTVSADLDEVVVLLRQFLLPPSQYLVTGEPFGKNWFPPGPWTPEWQNP